MKFKININLDLKLTDYSVAMIQEVIAEQGKALVENRIKDMVKDIIENELITEEINREDSGIFYDVILED